MEKDLIAECVRKIIDGLACTSSVVPRWLRVCHADGHDWVLEPLTEHFLCEILSIVPETLYDEGDPREIWQIVKTTSRVLVAEFSSTSPPMTTFIDYTGSMDALVSRVTKRVKEQAGKLMVQRTVRTMMEADTRAATLTTNQDTEVKFRSLGYGSNA